MSILCGTDFSEHANRALDAAAALATSMQLPLHLAHAVDVSHDVADEALRSAAVAWAKGQLSATAERLRSQRGLEVQEHLEAGAPDDVLLELAPKLGAKLIVVGALGRRQAGYWQLGSHAERLAQRSHVPVIVAREPSALAEWASGKRPLRVVLAADASLSCDAAARWISALCELGPCEVTAAHLYWPPAQFQRLGLHGVRSYVEPDPEVTRVLQQEFAARFAGASFAKSLAMHFEPHMGRVGDRIAALASEREADLIVVGSHAKNRVERIVRGSVSHDVLNRAHVSVACIPAPEAPESLHERPRPALRKVLCATDFSKLADAAVPLAYAVAAGQGTVHLVHVTKEPPHPSTAPHDIFAAPSEANAAVREQLSQRTPDDASAGGAATQVHVLAADSVAAAIVQAAERLDVDVICIGTHGRTGIAKKLLGSVAEEVIRKTRRPVLLARAPIE